MNKVKSIAEKEYIMGVVEHRFYQAEHRMFFNHVLTEDWNKDVTPTSITYDVRLVSDDMKQTLKTGTIVIKDSFISIDGKGVKVSAYTRNKGIDKLIKDFIGSSCF